MMVAVIVGEGTGLFSSTKVGVGSSAGVGQDGSGYTVNALNGNLTIQRKDQWQIGDGIDSDIVRTYNSQGNFSDSNQDNFRFSFNQQIKDHSATQVTRVSGDGSETIFDFDVSLGLYVSSSGVGAHDSLQLEGSLWTYTEGSSQYREVYDWDSSGRLIRQLDERTNTLSIGYNADGLVNKIVQSADLESLTAQRIEILYIGSNVHQIRNLSEGASESLVHYSYDVNNRLERVKVDLTPEDNNIADGQIYETVYTYDGSSKRIESVTHSDSSTSRFEYEFLSGSYRVSAVVHGDEASDHKTQRTEFRYDLAAKKTEVVSVIDSTVTPSVGYITSIYYDENSRLQRVDTPANDVGRRNTVEYFYDEDGRNDDNLTRIVDGLGNSTVFDYDDFGNVIYERDAAGNVVESSYNSEQQLVASTNYLGLDPDGDDVGVPTGALTTRYVYDDSSRLRFVVAADGAVIETEYWNTVGGQRVESQFTYIDSKFTTNDQMELSLSELVAWRDSSANLRSSQRTDYYLDFRGQHEKIQRFAELNADGTGIVTADENSVKTHYYIYDQYGLLLKSVTPKGEEPTLGGHVRDNYETAFSYDGLGRLISSTSPVGDVVSSVYDNNYRIATTNAEGLLETKIHDSLGQLMSITRADASTLESLGESYQVFDNVGRLRASQDETGVVGHLLYNGIGQIVGAIDGGGALTEYQYDSNGNQVVQIEYSIRLTDEQLASLITWNNGHIDKANDVTLADLRPSDTEKRLTRQIVDDANRVIFIVDAEGYVTENIYDGASQIIEVIGHGKQLSGEDIDHKMSLASIPKGLYDLSTVGYVELAVKEETEGEWTIIERGVRARGDNYELQLGMLTTLLTYDIELRLHQGDDSSSSLVGTITTQFAAGIQTTSDIFIQTQGVESSGDSGSLYGDYLSRYDQSYLDTVEYFSATVTDLSDGSSLSSDIRTYRVAGDDSRSLNIIGSGLIFSDGFYNISIESRLRTGGIGVTHEFVYQVGGKTVVVDDTSASGVTNDIKNEVFSAVNPSTVDVVFESYSDELPPQEAPFLVENARHNIGITTEELDIHFDLVSDPHVSFQRIQNADLFLFPEAWNGIQMTFSSYGDATEAANQLKDSGYRLRFYKNGDPNDKSPASTLYRAFEVAPGQWRIGLHVYGSWYEPQTNFTVKMLDSSYNTVDGFTQVNAYFGLTNNETRIEFNPNQLPVELGYNDTVVFSYQVYDEASGTWSNSVYADVLRPTAYRENYRVFVPSGQIRFSLDMYTEEQQGHIALWRGQTHSWSPQEREFTNELGQSGYLDVPIRATTPGLNTSPGVGTALMGYTFKSGSATKLIALVYPREGGNGHFIAGAVTDRAVIEAGGGVQLVAGSSSELQWASQTYRPDFDYPYNEILNDGAYSVYLLEVDDSRREYQYEDVNLDIGTVVGSQHINWDSAIYDDEPAGMYSQFEYFDGEQWATAIITEDETGIRGVSIDGALTAGQTYQTRINTYLDDSNVLWRQANGSFVALQGATVVETSWNTSSVTFESSSESGAKLPNYLDSVNDNLVDIDYVSVIVRDADTGAVVANGQRTYIDASAIIAGQAKFDLNLTNSLDLSGGNYSIEVTLHPYVGAEVPTPAFLYFSGEQLLVERDYDTQSNASGTVLSGLFAETGVLDGVTEVVVQVVNAYNDEVVVSDVRTATSSVLSSGDISLRAGAALNNGVYVVKVYLADSGGQSIAELSLFDQFLLDLGENKENVVVSTGLLQDDIYQPLNEKSTYRAQHSSYDGSWDNGDYIRAALSAKPAGSDAPRVERRIFDTKGRLVGSINSEGYLVEVIYNNANQRIQEISYESRVPAFDAEGSLINPLLLSEGDLNQLRPGSILGERTLHHFYNGHGEKVAQLVVAGYSYDESGDRTGERFAYLNEYAHDENGNIIQVTEYATAISVSSYEAMLPYLEQAKGDFTALADNVIRPIQDASEAAQNRVTTQSYDQNDLLETETDFRGLRQEIRYDSQGNVELSEEYSGDVLQAKNQWQYNTLGQLESETTALAFVQGQAKNYRYDHAGRVTGLTNEDGSETLYFYDTSGYLSYTVNGSNEIKGYGYDAFGSKAESRAYTLTLTSVERDQLSEGLLTEANKALFQSKIDADDQLETTKYDSRGLVEYHVDGEGYRTEFDYTAFQEISQKTQTLSSDGSLVTTTAYNYDSIGQVSDAVYDYGGDQSRLVEKKYDYLGREIELVDAGRSSHAEFDSSGFLIRTVNAKDQYGVTVVDRFGRVTVGRNVAGEITRAEFDDVENTKTVTSPGNKDTKTHADEYGRTKELLDARGSSTYYKYDEAGNVIEKSSALGVKSHFHFDSLGRLTRQWQSTETRTTDSQYQVYDQAGRVSFIIDASGSVQENTYNGHGDLAKTTRYTREILTETLGNVVTESAVRALLTPWLGRDRVTYFAYNKNSQVVYEVNGDGQAKRYLYNGTGSLVGVAKYANVIDISRDKAEYLRSEISALLNREEDLDVRDLTIFDTLGRKKFVASSEGQIREFVYDVHNKISAKIAYSASLTVGQMDLLWSDPTSTLSLMEALVESQRQNNSGRVERFVHDELGRVVFNIDIEGGVIRSFYDDMGRVTNTVTYASRIILEGLGFVLSTEQVEAALAVRSSQNTEYDRYTSFRYDADGQRIFSIAVDGSVTENTYDNVGNLLEVRRYAQKTTDLSLTSSQLRAMRGVDDVAEYHAYNKTNQLTHKIAGDGTLTEYTYNDLGQLASERSYVNSLAEEIPAYYRFSYQVRSEFDSASGQYTPLMAVYAWYADGSSELLERRIALPSGESSDTDVWGGASLLSGNEYDGDSVPVRIEFRNLGTVDSQKLYVDDLKFGTRVIASSDDDASYQRNIGTSEIDYQLEELIRPGQQGIGPGSIFFDLSNLALYEQVISESVISTDALELLRSADDHHIYYAYDSQGRRTHVVDPMGGVVSSNYDQFEQLSSERNLSRKLTPLEIDGLLLAGNSADYLFQFESNQDAIKYYGYTDNGQALWRIDAEGGLTTFEYNGTGASTLRRSHSLQLNNLQITEIRNATDQRTLLTSLTSENDQFSYNVYDRAGRLKATANAERGITYYSYNTFNEIVEERQLYRKLTDYYWGKFIGSNGLPNMPSSYFNAKDRVTRNYYDAEGNLEFILQRTGDNSDTAVITQQHFNRFGLMTQSVTYDFRLIWSNSITHESISSSVAEHEDESNRQVRFVYDESERLRYTLKQRGENRVDVVENIYDNFGNLTHEYSYGTRTFENSSEELTALALTGISSSFDSLIDRENINKYDELGRVIETGVDGRFIHYNTFGVRDKNKELDANNRVVVQGPNIAVTDLYGNSWAVQTGGENYSYDAFGNVSGITKNYRTDGAVLTEYVYDKNGRQISTIYPDAGRRNADGDLVDIGVQRRVNTIYDRFGNAVVKDDNATDSFEYKAYDRNGRLRFEIDGEQYATEYQYDQLGNQIAIIRHASQVNLSSHIAGDAISLDTVESLVSTNSYTNRRIDVTFDSLGRKINVKRSSVSVYSSETNSARTLTPEMQLTLNSFGEVIHHREMLNYNVWADTYSYYDRVGNQIAAVDAEKFLTEWKYDSFGNRVRQIEYSTPLSIDVNEVILPVPNELDQALWGANREQSWIYDKLNRVESHTWHNLEWIDGFTDESGDLSESFVYDTDGNVVHRNDIRGAEYTLDYDDWGRLISKEGPDRTISYLYDEYGNVRNDDNGVWFVYDRLGQVIFESGNKQFEYNLAGEVEREWQTVSFDFDDWDSGDYEHLAERLYEYDDVGQLVKTSIRREDGSYAYETAEYNGFGELSNSSGAAGNRVYARDKAGRVTRDSGGPKGDVQYEYDLLGNTTRVTELGGSGTSDNRVTRVEYNKLGQAIKEIDPTFHLIRLEKSYTPTKYMTLDRWGNVLSTGVADDAGAPLNLTYYTYNHQNKVTKETKPDVEAFDESGLASIVNPEMSYKYTKGGEVSVVSNNLGVISRKFYDSAGRVIRVEDEKQRVNIGYNDEGRKSSEGNKRFFYDGRGNLVRQSFYLQTGYDVWGNEVDIVLDQARYEYDQTGNRVSTELVENFNFDVITYDDKDSWSGAVTKSYNKYDINGNVVGLRDSALRETFLVFDDNNNKLFEDDGFTNQRWSYDEKGRLATYTDRANKEHVYTYTSHGEVKTDAIDETDVRTYSYYGNGLLESISDRGVNALSSFSKKIAADKNWLYGRDFNENVTQYEYNSKGQRTREDHSNTHRIDSKKKVWWWYNYVQNDVQNTRRIIDISYDSNDRLSRVTSDSHDQVYTLGNSTHTTSGSSADVEYSYDSVGNRRRVQVSAKKYGKADVSNKDNWFTYDSYNRLRVNEGRMVDGEIKITSDAGVEFTYDEFGRRATMRRVLDDDSDQLNTYGYEVGRQLNEYGYTDSSIVYGDYGLSTITTEKAEEVYTGTSSVQTGISVLKRWASLNGRVYAEHEILTGQKRFKQYTYHSVAGEYSDQLRKVLNNVYVNNEIVYQESHDYSLADSYDAAGNMTHYSTRHWQKTNIGAYIYTRDFNQSYRAIGGEYKVSSTSLSQSDGASGTSFQYYDNRGFLVYALGVGEDSFTRSFENTREGQILARRSNTGSAEYYYANGSVIGEVGTTDKSVKFGVIDRDKALGDIGNLSNRHTVKPGDTLQSIAAGVYGDASLWYVIAQANGLSVEDPLVAGTELSIPSVLSSTKNSSDIFKPYNPSERLGKLVPELQAPPPPPPPQRGGGGGGCGFFEIVTIAIVIVATVYTAGAFAVAAGAGGTALAAGGAVLAGTTTLTAGTAFAAAFVGGFVGSLAGQAFGIATGQRTGFNWSEAAIGGLTTAATAGMAGYLKGAEFSNIAAKAISGASGYVSSYASQKAMGMDVTFNWGSVASAAIGSALVPDVSTKIGNAVERFGREFVKSFASKAINSTVRRLITKEGKQDWSAIAADGFGNAIANSYVGNMNRQEETERLEELETKNQRARDIARAKAHSVSTNGNLRASGSQNDVWYEERYGLNPGEQLDFAPRDRNGLYGAEPVDEDMLAQAYGDYKGESYQGEPAEGYAEWRMRRIKTNIPGLDAPIDPFPETTAALEEFKNNAGFMQAREQFEKYEAYEFGDGIDFSNIKLDLSPVDIDGMVNRLYGSEGEVFDPMWEFNNIDKLPAGYFSEPEDPNEGRVQFLELGVSGSLLPIINNAVNLRGAAVGSLIFAGQADLNHSWDPRDWQMSFSVVANTEKGVSLEYGPKPEGFNPFPGSGEAFLDYGFGSAGLDLSDLTGESSAWNATISNEAGGKYKGKGGYGINGSITTPAGKEGKNFYSFGFSRTVNRGASISHTWGDGTEIWRWDSDDE